MNNIEIVNKLDKAFREKDEATYADLLHPEYTFEGPMMRLNSKEEAVTFMKTCPFSFHNENSQYIVEGGKVIRLFDWVVTAPFEGRFRMAEYLFIENGKVRSTELFYDTAPFPKEAMQQMMQDKVA